MRRGHGGARIGETVLYVLYRISSLKLTIGLLLWIALVCIAATVIPQHPVHIPSGASFTHSLLGLISPGDLFHSLWLAIPALILSFNLLGCMALGIRIFFRKGTVPAMPAGICFECTLPGGTDPGRIQKEIALGLGRGYRVRQAEHGSSWVVFGEKGRARAFAPVLAHGGILLIILGAALGTFGYKGVMEIPEGGSSDTVALEGGGEMRLPFAVRCDKFSVEYYKNGMPKEYRSDLAFTDQGQTGRTQALMVNHPVRHEGILFSQSGYDPVLKARLRVRKGAAQFHALAEEHTYFILDEDRYQVNVVKLAQDVMHLGPAAELMIETPQGPKHLWVFRDIDRFRARFPGITERMAVFDPSSVSPYTFTLEDMTTRYATVLSLNRDPGEAGVAVGVLLFLAGIFIIFLVPSGFIWISLDKADRGLRVKAAQVSNGKACIIDEGVLDYLQSLKGGHK